MRNRLLGIAAIAVMAAGMSFTAYARPNQFEGFNITLSDVPYSDQDIIVNTDEPIPDELYNTPSVDVPGFEYPSGEESENIFSGKCVVYVNDDMSVAKYENGSVGVLYDDGTFEGVGADGSIVWSDPKTGEFKKETEDGTQISYVAGGELKITEPDGDTIKVAPGGDTTIERGNGLISKHDSDGKIVSLGLEGSGNMWIDMTQTEKGSVEGGYIEGRDGISLEVSEDRSFTFKDENDSVFHIDSSLEHVKAQVNGADGFSLKADEEGLTISPKGNGEHFYEFNEEGVASIPVKGGGSIDFFRDSDAFSYLSDSDDFNFVIDKKGNLVEADDGNEHFSLKVKADGSIISGQYKLDDQRETVELKEDGSGTREKDGGRLVVSETKEVVSEGFDWFKEPDLTQPEEQDDEEEESLLLWQDKKWDGEIEPLKLQLSLYYDGACNYSVHNRQLDQEIKPRNTWVEVDKKGNVSIYLAGFQYKSMDKNTTTGNVSDIEYERGSRGEVRLKGKIVKTYKLVNSNDVIYCQYGIITQKSHLSGEWEDWGFYYARDPDNRTYLEDEEGNMVKEPYKVKALNYELDVLPYDKDDDIESEFTIYYSTKDDSYQVDLVLYGKKTGYDFFAGFDNSESVPDSSRDEYENFTDEDDWAYFELCDGDEPSDWKDDLESATGYEIKDEIWYGY